MHECKTVDPSGVLTTDYTDGHGLGTGWNVRTAFGVCLGLKPVFKRDLPLLTERATSDWILKI